MEIEELLVAIGVDTTQAAKINDVVVALGSAAIQMATSANQINQTLDNIAEQSVVATEAAKKKADAASSSIGKLKLIAVGVGAMVGYISGRVLGFINHAVAGAKTLAKEKGLLFNISQQELTQADEYQAALKKTGLSIDSVKTKIALNLLPQLTSVTNSFNNWLSANKNLITNGLTKTIRFGGKMLQVVINTGRALAKVIDRTVGWKGAIIGLTAAFVLLNRAMFMNPITWIIAIIIGLMLVIDDLMVYLDGGDSEFGEFWGSCIKWIKAVMAWWGNLSSEFKTTLKLLGGLFAATFGSKLFSSVIKGVSKFGSMLKWLGSPFGKVIKVVKVAGRAFIWLGRALLMNPIGIVITLVAGLIYVLYDLYKWITTGESKFGDFWKTVSETWQKIKTFFRDGVKDILKSLGMSEEGAEKAVKVIGEVFDGIVDLITLPFRKAWELITGLFGIWGTDTDTVTQKIGKTFALVKNMIKKPFSEAFDWVMKKYDATIGKLKSLWNSAKSLVGLDDDDAIDVSKRAEELNDIVQTITASPTPDNGNAAIGSGVVSTTTNSTKTTINEGNVTVNQHVVTSDPLRAADLSVKGIDRERSRTARNLKTLRAN
ncbi:hypothetical protein C9426_14910 [Serratia sp. S1B]|nr:hypothetical protein C9426_14910 [Serratia sp. S1B]